jgi:hypothetical protein
MFFNDIAEGIATAALWSDGEPLDYDPEIGERGGLEALTLDAPSMVRLTEAAAMFYLRNADDCLAYVSACEDGTRLGYDESNGSPWEHLGHDLYLSASRAGTGAWDRGLGPLGTRLDGAAERELAWLEHAMFYAVDENTASMD